MFLHKIFVKNTSRTLESKNHQKIKNRQPQVGFYWFL